MRILKEALDIMFPRNCMICGGLSDLKILDAHVCKRCLQSIVRLPLENRWQFCRSEPFTGDKYPALTLYVPFAYEGQVSSVIHKIKFGKKQELARMLGFFLGESLKKDNVIFDAVIPVPLSRSRLEERGFNQAAVIGSMISEVLNVPILCDVLIRSRETQRQAELKDNVRRADNVLGAFVFNESYSVDGLRVLLVDDVATTGNTLYEAASVLLQNGASSVLCCAFASNRARKNAETY